MIISILFLPILFLIGLITSYEDFKYHKIRNKWIIFGIAWGLGLLILLFFWNFVGTLVTHFFNKNNAFYFAYFKVSIFTVPLPFFQQSIINFIISIFVGYIIWLNKFWSAGDAKLFIVCSLLIPISNYWKSYLPLFPSMALLINIFVIVIFYIFFRSLFYWIKKIFVWIRFNRTIKLLKNINFNFRIFITIINSFKITILVVLIFLFFIVFQDRLTDLFKLNFTYLQMVVFSLLTIFGDYLNKILNKKKFLFIVFVILILLFIYGSLTSLSQMVGSLFNVLKISFIFMVIFGLFQKLVNSYTEIINKNDIANSDLIDKKIKIMPFAWWIFIGVLITLLIKGSVLNLFLLVFQRIS